ncbi:hypothetical protein ONZ45_g6440 [Pleurotus djamor]|nr:hypothetical protein ONZ45_g6440 [Pleurotus djamor]
MVDQDPLSHVLKPQTRNWAKGKQLEFFNSHLEGFLEAVHASGDTKAIADNVVNRYFELFDWRLPVSQDPTPDAPLPNSLKVLSAEETKLKGRVVAKMRTSITNWLHYNATKTVSSLKHLKSTDTRDPYALLLSKLSGVGTRPPKRANAWEVCSKPNFNTYKDEVDNLFEASGKEKKYRATERNKFMSARFSKLPEAQRLAWEKQAQEQYDVEVQARADRVKRITSLSPVERQEALRRLGDFFWPILEGVSTILNMHVSVFVGGPEPARGGALNVLSLHSGQNRDAIPKTWGEADPKRFEAVTDSFLAYLETCYTLEDRAASAIPGAPTGQGSRTLRTTLRSQNLASSSKSHPPSHEASDDDSDISDHRSRSRHRSRHHHRSRSRRHSRRRHHSHHSRRRSRDYSSDSESVSGNDHIESDHQAHRGRHRKHKRDHRNRSTKQTTSIPKGSRKTRTRGETNDDVADDRRPSKRSRKQRVILSDQESDPIIPTQNIRIGPPIHAKRIPTSKRVEPSTFAYPTSRANADPPYLKAPANDPYWPDWFRSLYGPFFEITGMPDVWSTLLATYVLLERQTNFDNPGPQCTLPAEDRPEEVHWWVHRGRSKFPTITDIDSFASTWWDWWKGMQPKWRNLANVSGPLNHRHRSFPLTISEARDAWTELDKPGQNGFLSVVATLGWLGHAIEHKNSLLVLWNREVVEGRDWALAAADVVWVMQRIAVSRTHSGFPNVEGVAT